MIDPIVEEVRKYRDEHTRKCDGKLRTICQDLRKLEGTVSNPVVAPAPKYLQPTDRTPQS